ncbi:MAG: trypsin-like peptidase domain-containing protein [Verrucomicrobiota bacterium]
MKVFSLITFCSLLSIGFGETIVLKDGNTIQGDLLKQSEDAYFIDLGFDILKVPMTHVEKVVDTVSEKASEQVTNQGAKKGSEFDSSQLYRLGNGSAKVRTVKENAEQVGSAVVQVRTTSGLGSGFVINPAGYVVTNNHVISGEHKISVVFFKKNERELEKVSYDNIRIVATSEALDLALLKVITEKEEKFAYLPISQPDQLRQGQTVFAVGSPLGLGRSVSSGIVSARNRVVGEGLTYIQHTAQINSGNSGGPLFSLRGEVVGVLNMKMASVGVEGMGFAIPSMLLEFFLHNVDAYAFDPRNPNAGFRYLAPPGAVDSVEGKSEVTSSPPVGAKKERSKKTIE